MQIRQWTTRRLVVAGLSLATVLGGVSTVTVRSLSGPDQNKLVRQDILAAAAAEQAFLHKTDRFTTNAYTLREQGFKPRPNEIMSIRTFGIVHFCLVAAHADGITWYFYDSEAGYISPKTYPSRALAEEACTIPVTGPGSHIWFVQIDPILQSSTGEDA